jgi:predicted RNase H-like nuclease (RuvC/YqgF family)
MRIRILKIGLVLLATLTASAGAHAQSDTDRLREALRAATAQTRSLEDQRSALQAKIATAERDAAALKKQIDDAKAEVRQVEKQNREAVEEFNQRLAQRDETLEKWKSAYEEAATVARSKDAERAKFEGEAAAFKASTKSCQAKNVLLVKVGRELLHRYEGVSFGDMVVTSEPLIGVRRVEIQNLLQDYGDKILDQKVTP